MLAITGLYWLYVGCILAESRVSGRLQVYLALHFCIWLILVAYARKHYQVCGGGVRRRAGRCMLVRVLMRGDL